MVPDTGYTKSMFSLGGLSYTMTVETELDYFNGIVDTASSGIAIAAQSCSGCKVTPAYNPGGDYDKMAADQSKTAMGFFPDGSTYSGKIFKDQVWIQGDDFVDMDIVSIQSTTNPYFDPMVPVEAVMGFGPDAGLATGTDNYVTKQLAAIADSTVPNQLAFLPCAGRMWFDGFDPTVNTNDPMVDPPAMNFVDRATIDANNPFYTVGVSDFAFGGTALGESTAAFGGAIVALGSSVNVVPSGIETKILAAINGDAGYQSLFSTPLADTAMGSCVTNLALADSDVNMALPKFTVTFPKSGGGTFTVDLDPTESYLYSAGMGTYCLTFTSSGVATPGAIIGTGLLNGMFFVIDNDAKQVGFAPELACQPAPTSMRTTGAPAQIDPAKGLASSPYYRAPRALAH